MYFFCSQNLRFFLLINHKCFYHLPHLAIHLLNIKIFINLLTYYNITEKGRRIKRVVAQLQYRASRANMNELMPRRASRAVRKLFLYFELSHIASLLMIFLSVEDDIVVSLPFYSLWDFHIFTFISIHSRLMHTKVFSCRNFNNKVKTSREGWKDNRRLPIIFLLWDLSN